MHVLSNRPTSMRDTITWCLIHLEVRYDDDDLSWSWSTVFTVKHSIDPITSK